MKNSCCFYAFAIITTANKNQVKKNKYTMSSLNMTKTQQDRQQAKRRNSIGCEREVENPIYSSLSTCGEMSDASLFDLSTSSLGSWIVVDDDDDHHHNNNCYPDIVVGQPPLGVGGVARRYSWSYNSSFSIQHANDIFEREVQKQQNQEYHHRQNVFFDVDDAFSKEKDDHLFDHSEVVATRPPMLLPRCEKQQQEDKYQLKKKKKKTTKKKKTVRFSKIAELRNYPIIIGDNPSVWNGPPLSIGWQYMSIDIVEVPLTLSWRYYHNRSSFPRRRSHQERVELLISLGYSRCEIQYSTIQASTLRTKRKLTRKETKLSSFIQEHWQRTCRKMSNLVTFGRLKRKERSYLNQYPGGVFQPTR